MNKQATVSTTSAVSSRALVRSKYRFRSMESTMHRYSLLASLNFIAEWRTLRPRAKRMTLLERCCVRFTPFDISIHEHHVWIRETCNPRRCARSLPIRRRRVAPLHRRTERDTAVDVRREPSGTVEASSTRYSTPGIRLRTETSPAVEAYRTGLENLLVHHVL